MNQEELMPAIELVAARQLWLLSSLDCSVRKNKTPTCLSRSFQLVTSAIPKSWLMHMFTGASKYLCIVHCRQGMWEPYMKLDLFLSVIWMKLAALAFSFSDLPLHFLLRTQLSVVHSGPLWFPQCPLVCGLRTLRVCLHNGTAPG